LETLDTWAAQVATILDAALKVRRYLRKMSSTVGGDS